MYFFPINNALKIPEYSFASKQDMEYTTMMTIWSTDLSLSNSVIFLVFNFPFFTMDIIQSFFYWGHKEACQGKQTYIKKIYTHKYLWSTLSH